MGKLPRGIVLAVPLTVLGIGGCGTSGSHPEDGGAPSGTDGGATPTPIMPEPQVTIDSIPSTPVVSGAPCGWLGAGKISDLSYSRDGRFLFAVDDVGARVYDAATGNAMTEIALSQSRFAPASASADGTRVALFAGLSIGVWRTADGALLFQSPQIPNITYAFALSSDGKTVAVGDGTGKVSTWNVDDGSSIGTFQANTAVVTGIQYSPDGRTLATADANDLRLWSVSDGRMLQDFPLETAAASKLTFSDDGQVLLAKAGQYTVFRVADGTKVGSISSTSAALSADGGRVVAVQQGQLSAYAVGATTLTMTDTVSLPVTADVLVLAPDGRRVALGSSTVAGLSSGPWPGLTIDWTVTGANLPAGVAAGKSTIATFDTAGDIRLWSADGRTLERTLKTGQTALADTHALRLSPKEDVLVYRGASYDAKNVYVNLVAWDLAGDKLLFSVSTVESAESGYAAIDFSPDGSKIVTVGNDLRIWRTSDGMLLGTIPRQGKSDTYTGVLVAADARTIVANTAQLADVFDATTLANIKRLMVLPFGGGSLTPFTDPLDRSMVAAGSSDGWLRIFRPMDWSFTAAIHAHSGGTDIRYTADGTRFVSYGSDGIMRTWDAADLSNTSAVQTDDSFNFVGITRTEDGQDRAVMVDYALADRPVHLWCLPR